MSEFLKKAFEFSGPQKGVMGGGMGLPYLTLAFHHLGESVSYAEVTHSFTVAAMLVPLYASAIVSYNMVKGIYKTCKESELEQKVQKFEPLAIASFSEPVAEPEVEVV